MAGPDGFITVRGRFKLASDVDVSEYDAKISPKFQEYLQQVREDALTGTFGEFDPSIFSTQVQFETFQEKSAALAQFSDRTGDDDVARGVLPFELRLAAEAFSAPTLGLQKIVHVLVSDLFERQVNGLRGEVEIASIDLGSLEKVFVDAYRARSHTTADIRRMFALQAEEPLLAFTIKPRSGLSQDDYIHLANEAFEGGCHIVEMDTRDLDLSDGARKDLVLDLSARALRLSTAKVPRRFSANLSGPAYAVKDLIEALGELHARAPTDCWVVKVDGNLDGLSTIQAIRNGAFALAHQPVVTCYPVLKYGLRRYLGADSFVRFLSLSGADIIYPGSRPQFRGDKAIDGEQFTAARAHYENMRKDGYPLLSVAGGVSIGHVHSTIALLGPDIAFFVGGGIALSKHGVRTAAANFSKAIKYALEDVKRPKWNDNEFRDRYVPLTKVYTEGDEVPVPFEYVSPCSLLNRGIDMHYRPKKQ